MYENKFDYFLLIFRKIKKINKKYQQNNHLQPELRILTII